MKDYGLKIGDRFGKLVVSGKQFSIVDKKGCSRSHILCKCDCGHEKVVKCYNLTHNRTNSCGCSKGFEKSEYGRWKCNCCGEIFQSRAKMFSHSRNVHNNGARIWNKGKTALTDERIARMAHKLKMKYKSGELKDFWDGKHLPKEVREKISDSMKKAHKEGRAHNIGICRWNNEPSYPEKFFMRVIEENFEDKNYRREFPFVRFSLDFAWVEKKKCVEIDGDQHIRFDDYKARDAEKDRLLKENGWSVLRIRWKDMFASPKEWISKAKEFIDGG